MVCSGKGLLVLSVLLGTEGLGRDSGFREGMVGLQGGVPISASC